MTLSSYKINKIMEKWVNGKEVKAIAREEKVCPETVRRYLEKNGEQTGYNRGIIGQIESSKKTDVLSPLPDNRVELIGNKTVKKSKNRVHRKNPSPDIDQVCSRLEQMMQQEDNLRTTLLDSDSIDIHNPNQTLVMTQLVEEIKNIHGQLAEFRQELGCLQSSVKKKEDND
jgi:hypothetical protein